jgi:hypothetical protein
MSVRGALARLLLSSIMLGLLVAALQRPSVVSAADGRRTEGERAPYAIVITLAGTAVLLVGIWLVRDED